MIGLLDAFTYSIPDILELLHQTALRHLLSSDHPSLIFHLIASALLLAIFFMLETKRVVAYGKRSSRIVYVSNDSRVSHDSPKHRMNCENATSISPAALRKVLSRGRKVHGLSTSPRGSPKSGNIFGLTSKRSPDMSVGITPSRRPLKPKNVVLPSPSKVYLGQRTTQTSDAKLTTFAPFVDSDIVMFETPGRRIAGRSNKFNKGRTHRPQRTMNQVDDDDEVIRPPRRRAMKKAIVQSENEDDIDDGEDGKFKLTLARHGASANPIVISDDENGDDAEISHPESIQDAIAPLNAPLGHPQSRLRGGLPGLRTEVSIPTTHLSAQSKQPRGKGHLLHPPDPTSVRVPRRNLRHPRRLKEPHKPPPVKLDLDHSIAALSLDEAPVRPQLCLPLPEPSLKPPAPAPHLTALLAACGQTTPQCFSTFVQTFPLDDIHEDNFAVDLTFRKIGEASYSEVFAIGNVVLKIIPLRDESRVVQQSDSVVDTPQESDAKDVLQEVIVTQEMGQTCPGFIKLLRCVYGSISVLRESLHGCTEHM